MPRSEGKSEERVVAEKHPGKKHESGLLSASRGHCEPVEAPTQTTPSFENLSSYRSISPSRQVLPLVVYNL